MFWTSRTSHTPRWTSSGGLYAALAALVGSNSRTRPNLVRDPAIKVQFSPLMSWTIAEPSHVAFAGSSGREAQDMLRVIMTKAMVAPSAKQHSVVVEQAALTNFTRLGPARRTVGGDALQGFAIA